MPNGNLVIFGLVDMFRFGDLRLRVWIKIWEFRIWNYDLEIKGSDLGIEY